MNTKIGSRLAHVRKLRNLTQGQLAAQVGVTKQTISNYENGVRMPDFEILDNLAIALNTTLSYLVGSSDDPDEMPRKLQDIGDQLTAPFKSPRWHSITSEISDLEFALSGEIHDLTEDEMQDVLDYVRFKRAQKARQEGRHDD